MEEMKGYLDQCDTSFKGTKEPANPLVSEG
jgi:hypothetical protein